MIWAAKAVKRISNCYLGRQPFGFEMSLASHRAKLALAQKEWRYVQNYADADLLDAFEEK